MENSVKEILLLQSSDLTGKTTSINMLFNKVVEYYTLGYEKKTKLGEDRKDVIEINGKKVGFSSAGDNVYEVKESIKFFRNDTCDICITAFRNNDNLWDRMYSFADEGKYDISIFDFCSLSKGTDEHANDSKANMMLDRFKFLIGG